MEKTDNLKKLKCGIIMPLSTIDEQRTEEHFDSIQDMIKDTITSITEYDFECEMVSKTVDSAAIHKNIIQNIYTNDIIICDVSGHNANVYFELGVRLAVDAPTIIIHDNENGKVKFDIGSLHHKEYPLNADYTKNKKFQKELREAVLEAYKAKETLGDEYSQYMSQFGGYRVKGLEEREINSKETLELVLKRMDDISEYLKKDVKIIGAPDREYFNYELFKERQEKLNGRKEQEYFDYLINDYIHNYSEDEGSGKSGMSIDLLISFLNQKPKSSAVSDILLKIKYIMESNDLKLNDSVSLLFSYMSSNELDLVDRYFKKESENK